MVFPLLLSAAACGEVEMDVRPEGRTVQAALCEGTKTSLDGLQVLWSEGDAIGLFNAGSVYPYTLTLGAGTSSASFYGADGPVGTPVYAYYPFAGAVAANGTTLTVDLPSEQPYSGASFASGIFPSAAVSQDGESFVFNHLGAVLSLSLKGTGQVTSVRLEATAGEALCGEGTVSFVGTPALAVSGQSAVTMVCPAPIVLSDTPVTFPIVIPPGTYSQGFTVTVTDIYGASQTRKTAGAATIGAGRLYSFATALSLTATVPDETDLAVWTCDAAIPTTHADFVATYTSGTTSAKVYDDAHSAWWEYVCDGQSRTSQAYKISSGDYQFQAGPSFENDCFLFTIPVTDFPAGGVLCLKGGLQAYANGTPDRYVVEYFDEGEWKLSQRITLLQVSGKSYSERTEINAPARFTSAVASGQLQMRIRCATSTSRLNSPTDAPTAKGLIRLGGLTKANGSIRVVRQEKPAEIPADTDPDTYLENSYTTESFAPLYTSYLSGSYPAAVTQVSVTDDQVTITGTAPAASGYSLADIPPMQNVAVAKVFTGKQPITETAFSITVPRYVLKDGVPYDRVQSKWAVVRVDGGTHTLCSKARFADSVTPAKSSYSPPALSLRNKKGIGGIRANADFYADLDDLDAGSVTMNITLNNFISTAAEKFSSNKEFVYNGVTYNINNAQVSSYDARLKECADRGVVVAGIILMSKSFSRDAMGTILVHPESNYSGHYALPNLTTAEGVAAYSAALAFLAQRYDGHPISGVSRRIHHWIVHNEVDYAGSWLSMTGQSLQRFMDYYIKSMRVCYNIVRQYDPNASVMTSFTHCWTQADGEYAPKDMLDVLLAEGAAEGDFRWGIAAHPYPQNLYLPRFWENDSASSYSMDTGYITFKNPEVWDAWMKDASHKYLGSVKRLLFFSENGTNAYNGDETSQAAGAAWIWKKVSALDGIDAIQWHNWMDSANEGLNIGLRDQAGNTRPVWNVWQAAGTSSESMVFDPYLPTLGRSSWSGLIQPVQ